MGPGGKIDKVQQQQRQTDREEGIWRARVSLVFDTRSPSGTNTEGEREGEREGKGIANWTEDSPNNAYAACLMFNQALFLSHTQYTSTGSDSGSGSG